LRSYEYHFYTAHYGEVFDYLDINLEGMNMMFLVKRYARTNDDKTLMKILESNNHKKIENKILFTDNDDFNDRITFYCYKKAVEGESSGNTLRNLDENSDDVIATLTYEFFPNIVYNINFKPRCSKHIPIDKLKPVKLLLNGKLVPPGDAPVDFDESVVEQKNYIDEYTNSVEVKFKMEDRRKGKVYLKDFKFSTKNMINDVPKSVHREGNGAYDPRNGNGTDPQNQFGDKGAGEETAKFNH
jgi:hypothetical protein